MRKFKNNKEISEIVKSFENATIKREDWKHAEHLMVALYYLSKHDYQTAYNKMRSGIFNLLKAFNVDFSKEMPYHETLTVFWLRTIDDFRKEKIGFSIVEICNDLIATHDKDFPLKFYSREQLFSDKAREKFVENDL